MAERPNRPPPIHPAITIPHDFQAEVNIADVWAWLEARVPLPEQGAADYRREWREAVFGIANTLNLPRSGSMTVIDALACVGTVKDALTYALLVANGQMKRKRPRRPKKPPKPRLRLVKGKKSDA